jgi:hypothetical protein
MEARVITLAQPPFLIGNVNEMWTRTTGYTQKQVEGKEYLTLLEVEDTVLEGAERPGQPKHKLEDVAAGRCACSTNIGGICRMPHPTMAPIVLINEQHCTYPDTTMILFAACWLAQPQQQPCCDSIILAISSDATADF